MWPAARGTKRACRLRVCRSSGLPAQESPAERHGSRWTRSFQSMSCLATWPMLALTGGINLQSLVFADTRKGRPTVLFNALPGLPHERRNAEDSRVLIKGLSDGRIIAAGGEVDNDRGKADGEPGSRRASRYDDIYDPSSRAWKRSAPFRGSGGPVAILNDDRVVRLSRIAAPGSRQKSRDGAPSKEIALLEVCSADGLSWRKRQKTVSGDRQISGGPLVCHSG